MAAIPPAIAADFKVYDYTAYSLIGRFKEPEKWNNWVFNTMDSLVRNKYNTQYYLLIAKEINPSDGKVRFRVKLSLPTVANLPAMGASNLTPFSFLTQDALNRIKETTLVEIENILQAKNDLTSKDPEKNGIERVKELLEGGFVRRAVNEASEAYEFKGDRSASGINVIGLTPLGKVINKLPEGHSLTIIRYDMPFVVAGFDISTNDGTIEYYEWKIDGYKNKKDEILNLDLKDTTDLVRVRYCNGEDDCYFGYQDIGWSNSLKVPVNQIHTKVIEANWLYGIFKDADKSCLAKFNDAIASKLCTSAEITTQAGKLVNLSTINLDILVTYVHSFCIQVLQNLPYNDQKIILRRILQCYEIDNSKENAILRLMSAIRTENYADFYTFLDETHTYVKVALNNKHKKIPITGGTKSYIKHIIEQFDDFGWPWQGNNYTNFIGALVWMYDKNPQAIYTKFPVSSNNEDILNAVLPIGKTNSSLNKFYYGDYNTSSGYVDLYENTYETVIIDNKNSKNDSKDLTSTYTKLRSFPIAEQIHPLRPIYIDIEPDLDLVKTAIEGASPTNKGIVVPAIFLKYNSDKIRNDYIEKGVMAALDITTIATGVPLFSAVSRLKRLYAMAEVAGAVGNIAVNSNAVPKEYQGAVNGYNTIVGLIGVKNVAVAGYRGIKNFATSTPKAMDNALSTAAKLSDDVELVQEYNKFKDEVNKIRATDKDIDPQILKQEELLDKIMGAARVIDSDWDNFVKFFDIKGISVNKNANNGIIEFFKKTGNKKILEIDKNNLKVVDEDLFQMDDLTGFGDDLRKRIAIDEVEIDGIKYQTDGVEVAVDNAGNVRCAGNGTYCFAQDTPLPDGELMSEKQEGNYITAYDTEKKTTTQSKISKIRRSFTSAFTRLWIAGSVLSVTPAHALQTEAGEWIAAGQLQQGDYLQSANGVVRLDSTFTESVSSTPVISYELEGSLDYVVGEMPVVVAGICQLRSVVEAFDGNKAAFQNLIRGLNPSQRSALIQGIAEITDLTKRKDFIKAFVADANFSQGIIEDASLIKIWSGVSFLTALKNNVSFLNWLKKAQASHLSVHLVGEINSAGKAVGCHLQSAVDGIRVKILPNPPPVYNGIEIFRAKIEISGVTKDALSTFFPSTWTKERVLEEVASIISNPSNQVGGNVRKYQGLATDGITNIEVRLTGASSNLVFDTAFPY